MAPAVGSIWRCRHASKVTVRVTGTESDRVLSVTLTDDAGKVPASETTNSTVADLWGWMYEPIGLGAST